MANLHLDKREIETGGMFIACSGDQHTGLRTMIYAQEMALLDAERDRFEAAERVAVHRLGAATALGD